ncbi:MAG TPA: succinylglutamate desuccinylase/aspartoacylase family protein [Woeseiaceae bacterium]|nr:succinylglutamate desuccinylase/aspartoacylase family protein [Woeseiaceae bacterium]
MRRVTHITLRSLLASAALAAGAVAAAPGEPAVPAAHRPAVAARIPVSVPFEGNSVKAPPAPVIAPQLRSLPAGPPTDASSVAPLPAPSTRTADAGPASPDAGAASMPEREEGEEAAAAASEIQSDGPAPGEPEGAPDGTVEPPRTAARDADDPAPPVAARPGDTNDAGDAAERGLSDDDAPAVAGPQRLTAVELGLAIDLVEGPTGALPEVPLAEAVAQAEERKAKPLKLLHGEVPPGTAQRLSWSATELFEGVPVSTPVLVVNGRMPGPTLCLTAAVHGDELNGIEMVRRVMHDLNPKEVSGAVIGVPIVNLQGFRSASRYLPDRRDLNRYFPGRSYGSVASRIAYQFFEQVVRRCSALVDLHTGSLNRANLAQIRADLREVDNLRMAWGFGAEHIVHSVGQPGTLRRAANEAGIASVLYEAGEPRRIEATEIERGVEGLQSLMRSLDMLPGEPALAVQQRLYGRTHWVRSDASGIYVPFVGLGEEVQAGQPLAEVTDPFSRTGRYVVFAPLPGRVLGMARGQVVIPGFALFHIGLEDPTVSATDAEEVAAETEDAENDGDRALRAELAEERPE